MEWNSEEDTKERNNKVCLLYAKIKMCNYSQYKYKHVMMCKWTVSGDLCINQNGKFGHDRSTMCRWEARGNCIYKNRCRCIHTTKNREDRYMHITKDRKGDTVRTRERQEIIEKTSYKKRKKWRGNGTEEENRMTENKTNEKQEGWKEN